MPEPSVDDELKRLAKRMQELLAESATLQLQVDDLRAQELAVKGELAKTRDDVRLIIGVDVLGEDAIASGPVAP